MALLRPEAEIALVLGLALLFCGARARHVGLTNGVADVTKFGAKTGGRYDCAMSFMRAWGAACSAPGGGKVVIPPGNYMAGEVFWAGPCKGHVTVEVQGTITADKDVSDYPNAAWFRVRDVDGITITGANFKGSFHGIGAAAWKYFDKDLKSSGDAPAPPTFVFDKVKHGDVGYLSSIDSGGFHFKVMYSSDVKLHNLRIQAPATSPLTNALDTVSSSNVGIVDSVISTGGGKDCVIWGPGTTRKFFDRVSCNLKAPRH